MRGYGLIDSAKVQRTPGKTLNLKAVTAPSDAAAAQYYPAIYWYSMLKIPDKSEFPGTGEKGNGMAENLKHQEQWLDVGQDQRLQYLPPARQQSDADDSQGVRRIQILHRRVAAAHRLRAGDDIDAQCDRLASIQTSIGAFCRLDRPGRRRRACPNRSHRGRRVSSAISSSRVWDWSNAKAYLHDEIATDKRKPTVNANGPLYGSTELSTDLVPVLDPVRHRAYEIKHPVRDPNTPSAKTDPLTPSPYWGDGGDLGQPIQPAQSDDR